jgi:dynein heavy chain
MAAAQQLQDLTDLPSISSQVKALDQRIKAAEKEAAIYNSREALLGKPTTDYTMIRKMAEQFEPYQFWTTAADWRVRRLPIKCQQ